MEDLDSTYVQLLALEALESNPESVSLQGFTTRLSGNLDYSEEGILDAIKDTVSIILHKLYININRAYAKITKANEEVKERIEDLANRPHGDASGMPLSKAQAAGVGLVLAGAMGLIGLMAAKKPAEHLKNKYWDEPRRIKAEAEERAKREAEAAAYKQKIADGFKGVYGKAIKGGKWLGDRTDEINDATEGVMKAARLTSKTLDGASMRLNDIQRGLSKRRHAKSAGKFTNANGDEDYKARRADSHHTMALWKNYGEHGVNSLSKVAKFISGERFAPKERKSEKTEEKKSKVEKEAQKSTKPFFRSGNDHADYLAHGRDLHSDPGQLRVPPEIREHWGKKVGEIRAREKLAKDREEKKQEYLEWLKGKLPTTKNRKPLTDRQGRVNRPGSIRFGGS